MNLDSESIIGMNSFVYTIGEKTLIFQDENIFESDCNSSENGIQCTKKNKFVNEVKLNMVYDLQ